MRRVQSSKSSLKTPGGVLSRHPSSPSISMRKNVSFTKIENPHHTIRRNSSKSCLKRTGNVSASQSTSSPASMRKNVSFNKINISQHAYEIGDNPSTSGGCPVQLAWEPHSSDSFDLEEYDEMKQSMTRRTGKEMLLPAYVRMEMLQQSGVSAREVIRATREAQEVKKKRIQSVQNQKWDNVHYALEKTNRKIKKITSLTNILQIEPSRRRRMPKSQSISNMPQPTCSNDGKAVDGLDISRKSSNFCLTSIQLTVAPPDESDCSGPLSDGSGPLSF